jgi:acetyl esterase/lipase
MRLFRYVWVLTTAVGLIGLVFAAAQEKGQAKQPAPALLPNGMSVVKDLAYVPGGGPRQTLDLYLPKADGPRPLIVWVHGGGWRGGSKDDLIPALPLVTKGYAVAAINYRLSSQAAFPAQIQDCQAAVRYLRSVAKDRQLDPNHFGAWGLSAGGHLVALLGTLDDKAFAAGTGPRVSCRVQAVCDWFGPTDLPHFFDDLADEWKPRLRPLLAELVGGAPEDKKDLVVAASPITHVGKGVPPTLIMHGDNDPVVPYSQSVKFYEALKKAGVDTTLHKVEGGGHGPGFDKPEVAAIVESFFDKHLKNGTGR